MVDSLIVAFLDTVAWNGLATIGVLDAVADLAGGAGVLLAYLTSMLLSGAYFVTLWSGGRRTIGMRIFRLDVVRETDAGPVDITDAAIRWAIVDIPGLLLGMISFGSFTDALSFGLGAGLSWAWPLVLLGSVAISPTRQGLHDRVARTAVVIH